MWETYFRQYKDTVLPFWLDKQKWNYKDDIIMVGYDYLARSSGDNSWREAIFSSERYLIRPDGSVINLQKDNIDKISFGKSLRILRDQTLSTLSFPPIPVQRKETSGIRIYIQTRSGLMAYTWVSPSMQQ